MVICMWSQFVNSRETGRDLVIGDLKNLTRWLMPVIPTLQEAKVGGSPEVRILRPSGPTWWNPISTKNTKISRVWWHSPVIPATREAEAGESLEPRRQKLQWAEITPLHSSLGNKSKTLSQKKKEVYPIHVHRIELCITWFLFFCCLH